MSSQSSIPGNGRNLSPETHEAFSDLKSDFAKLRDDMSQMRKDFTSLGGSGASDLKSALKSGAAAAEEKAHQAAEYASSELHEIQNQAQRAVRKNPLSAIAAALAVGYFLSGLTKSRH